MRICHLGAEIVPTQDGAFVGGLAKSVATLAERQAEWGHEVEVVTSDVMHSVDNGQELPSYRVRPVDTRGRYGSMTFAATFLANAAREIRRANRERSFDLVHVHSAYSSLGTIANLLKGVNVPRIFSLYSFNLGLLPGHYCNGPLPLQGRLLGIQLLSAFAVTVVPSANLRNRLTGLGLPQEKVVRIPPILDPSMLEPLASKEEARKELNLPRGGPVVLYLGNYSRWKGIEVLLQAVEAIRRDSLDITLLTAWGEPYQWSGNRRQAILGLIDELGLSDTVQHLGIVEDVRSVYRAADLLALPLQCTCKVLDYPLSILEAMACERPVISTKVGGVPEIVDGSGCGVLVEPHDASSLADAIEMLLRDPLTARAMAQQGLTWVRENFTAESVRRRWEALYAQVGGEAAAPS